MPRHRTDKELICECVESSSVGMAERDTLREGEGEREREREREGEEPVEQPKVTCCYCNKGP